MADDPALVCLALVARFHGVAAEPAQLRHTLGLSAPAGAAEVLLAAKRLGLKAKSGRFDLQRAASGRLPLPCMVGLKSEDAAAPDNFAVLAKVEGERFVLHDPVAGRAIVLDLPAMALRSTGLAIFVASRATLANTLARFDFTWFIPALVRYRRLLGEVLIASLVLQLFALVTPLFFQAVVDKVLVHKGISTLTVIGIGLAGAMLFESALSALRTYLLGHTASRIDVELGARLFRHLLGLPLAYFEARRVGDSVARVRELENIRQFLTGPALMSLLDLAFTFVFIGVMLYYSVTLTLVVLASIPLYALLMGTAMPAFRRRLEEKFQRGAENRAY